MSIENEIKQMVGDAAALRPGWSKRAPPFANSDTPRIFAPRQGPTTASAVDKRLSEVSQQAAALLEASQRLAEHLVGHEANKASSLDASNNDTDPAAPLFERQMQSLDAIGEILDTAQRAVERSLAALS